MKTAFLFPGQGAQTVGMGQDVYQAHAAYREAFGQCEAGAGQDLKRACFHGEGMDEGEVAQPAIVAHSMGLMAVLSAHGVDAAAYAGLSLGEYSALCAAGVFTRARCAALVRERGRVMDNAFMRGEAGMLSVIGLPLAEVEAIVARVGGAYVANHLSEAQMVVAGGMPALSALKDDFTAAGARMAVLLNVRGPSHAPMLEGAALAFAPALAAAPPSPVGAKTVYAGALGAPYPPKGDVAALLLQQMSSRLLWHDCIRHMLNSGVTRFVEIGPSNVLTKLVSRAAGRDVQAVSVRDLDTLEKFLQREGDKA